MIKQISKELNLTVRKLRDNITQILIHNNKIICKFKDFHEVIYNLINSQK